MSVGLRTNQYMSPSTIGIRCNTTTSATTTTTITTTATTGCISGTQVVRIFSVVGRATN